MNIPVHMRFEGVAAESPPTRPGNKSLDDVLLTNRLYGHDNVWLGPRGRDYGDMLPDPKPYQKANLYPDPNATYWFATLEMPAGSVLNLKGRFPHARYFQYALYRLDPLGSFSATGESLLDNTVIPDAGSVNPFVPGTNRLSENRSYTVRIVNEAPPQGPTKRAANTIYAGRGNKIQVVYRVYLPDNGRDGSGDVGLPAYSATLADGTQLSAQEVEAQFNRPMRDGPPPGMKTSAWLQLRADPKNDPNLKPASTPARNPVLLERYFNNNYTLLGVFKPPRDRANIPSKVETGFGGDPVTLFMMAFVSRAFGPVLVIRGKMPNFPNTFYGEDGKGLAVMTDWETRYWSVIMSEAPPSGKGADALTDMQVPLDANRNYTIVVSRLEDRPANATDANGVAWMEWDPRGEGLDDPLNRTDFGLVLFRFMYTNPNWANDPNKIITPGTEAEVMGPYFPKMTYADKATFEASGLKK